MPEEKLPVVLLEDLPATDDAFGSHQEIAQAILEMVSTEVGGKAIALVGDWGSGKSTVVKLLEKLAERHTNGPAQSQTEVFVFDAWAHEGDPLRRSFLERLITTLQRRKWVDEDRWNRRMEELTRRSRKTETTSSPVFSPAGVGMLFLLYLIPLAVALVADSHNFWHKRFILTVGLILYSLPLVLALFHWLRRNGGDEKRFSLLGMLFNRSVERMTTDTSEAPDPTSVEFQQTFWDLASEAIASHPGPIRNLVLVIDNLDRVEVHDALNLWSSMSAFIEFPSENSPTWTKRIWTLVPFDERGIKRLWGRDPANPLGEAFLAKTFQVRFTVPGPLLSDWAAFLETQLRIAFPRHSDEEFYGISRVFSELCAKISPPNPRDIKTFVNQIGSTYRIHPEPVRLIHHSVLAALTYKGKEWKPTDQIPSKEELVPYIGADCETDLAALYYNVPKDKALQAIFGPRIDTRLLEGNQEDISALLQKPGLDYVILRAIRRGVPSWLKSEPFRIGRAAYGCGGATHQQTYVWREIWTTLEDAAKTAPGFPVLDERSGVGLAVLVNRCDDAQFTEKVLKNLSASELSGGASVDTVMPWFSGASEILNAVLARGEEEVIKKAFSFGRTPPHYLAFLEFLHAADGKSNFVQYFRPGCDPGKVMVELAEKISSTDFALYETAVQNMMRIPVRWEWKDLIGAAASRMQQVNAQPQDIGAMIRSLLRLERWSDDARNALSSCVQNGWIFHYLTVSYSGNFPTASASCLLAIMIYQPEANAPANPASAGQGRQFYRSFISNPHERSGVFEALSEQAEDLVPVEKLIEMARAVHVPRSVLLEIIRDLAKKPNAFRVFNAQTITDHHQFLSSELEPEAFRRIEEQSLKSGELSKAIIARPFAPALIGLYTVAIPSAGGSDVLEHVIRGLRAVTKADWGQALQTASELIPFLAELHDMKATLELDFDFRDALSALADQALSGTVPRIEPRICEKLVAVLDGDQRETFQRHLAEHVAEARKSLGVFIRYFGHTLNNCTFMSEVAERFVREGLPRILDRLEREEIEWVTDTLKRCPEIPKKSSASSLKTFKGRLQGKLNEELPDPVRTSLQELASVLGISRSNTTQNKQEKSDK